MQFVEQIAQPSDTSANGTVRGAASLRPDAAPCIRPAGSGLIKSTAMLHWCCATRSERTVAKKMERMFAVWKRQRACLRAAEGSPHGLNGAEVEAAAREQALSLLSVMPMLAPARALCSCRHCYTFPLS